MKRQKRDRGKTQREIKQERGNEEILLKRCQLEKGKVNVPGRKESCVPCYLHVALWVLCRQNGKT